MCKKEDIHVLTQHLPGMMTKAMKNCTHSNWSLGQELKEVSREYYNYA